MNLPTNPDPRLNEESLEKTASVENGITHQAEEPNAEAIDHELKLILNSPHFRTSKRSQQFLSYVVQYRLDGNLEPLKERTIGTELFKRPAGYATGDDAVVRVQAGEVRRRLHLYYQEPHEDSQVLIDLPLGSYAPEFHWRAFHAEPLPAPESATPLSLQHHEIPEEEALPVQQTPRRHPYIYALLTGLLFLAAAAGFWAYHERPSRSILAQFWAPIFANNRPVLICLPKPICYRPSIALYKRHVQTPGEFDSEVDRMNKRPHLKPDEALRWDDMWEYGDLGVGKGDVKAAIRLSSYLGRIHKDNEVRIDNEYTFEDMRTSPSIMIGAFSNRWTMQLTSGLHFAFAEDNAIFRIQEQIPHGRVWYVQQDRNGNLIGDYGIVTRLVNSSTGQFLLFVSGITASGSEAATEIATSPEGLEKALANAPPDWKNKNVQIIVRTSVTDSVPGPAQVVATYIW
jgi:hypothetical protein